MKWMNVLKCILLLTIISGFHACQSGSKEEGFHLRIRLKEDVDCLQPIVSQTRSATQIEALIMFPLIEYNMDKIELTPLLVKAIPALLSSNDSSDVYASDILPEAVWDNGTAVTAADYAFSVKAALNPFIKNTNWKSTLKNIRDIRWNEADPKHLEVVVSKNYLLAKELSGNINVYPEYVYDPERIMQKYTIRDLLTKDSSSWTTAEWTGLQKFADQFQSADFCKKIISGCGPYRLTSWESGSKIILEKKKNWWGEKYASNQAMLQANPDKISYLIIPDEATAVLALKDGSVDICTDISPRQFEALRMDSSSKTKLQFFTPGIFQYNYIDFNTRTDILSDLNVRRALAYLVDIPSFIQNVMQGLAQQVVGPVHPSRSYYNQQLKPIVFSIDSALSLLQKSSWKDSDKDGILDKMIKGKHTKLSLNLMVSSDGGKKLALLLQEQAKKIGVEINPVNKDFSLILKDLNALNFDMVALNISQQPSLYDPFQNWHSSNAKAGGSNRCGFATPETDSLIQIIRTSATEDRRNQAYLRFQEVLYEAQPQIFLFSPKERLIASSRIQLEPSNRRPGYLENMVKER